MNYTEQLERFYKIEHEIVQGERAVQIISWDWRAITPKKAASDRAETIGLVSARNFALMTSKDTRSTLDYLAQPENMSKMDKPTARRVSELKRDCDRQSKIPAELHAEFTILQAKSEAAWEHAKRTNDWNHYLPHLQNMFDYTNKMIDLWGYEGSRYNALLGYCEEGMTTDKLDALFSELRETIVPLVKKIADKNVDIDNSFLKQDYPVEMQRVMAKKLLEIQGFSFERGVLAESEHPYTCHFGGKDVRLTTHYYADQFLPAVFSTLHEGGHGIYEQCVADDLDGTIIGSGLRSGMHESVSRFWENMVGRSYSFWKCYLPLFKEWFPQQLGDVDTDKMYLAVNKTGRSFTRMEADELTYNLHIMLRYELERDVFDGKASVSDLPELWNRKMEQYLGLTPPTHTLGILQDIQWSMAQFGYFPAYALGNMYNAQYTAVIKKDLDFEKIIESGNLKAILDWKTEKLYKYGSIRTPDETIRALTGESLSAKYLAQHLSEKFSAIYNIK